MRNYIKLNGINSTTIPGLLIQELPPIVKPKIRTQVEEIDGRDGDIVTKLGYSAYDKTVKIGLYGSFDINEVIAFFNSEGTVIFSNEEDKYYNYEIVDQIDFERLVRYRTADVTFHCQPFKYSTTEEKIQIDATEVSGSGSNITLNNTENGALFTSLQINGDTSQTTYTGIQLFNKATANIGKGVSTANGTLYNDTNCFATDYIPVTTGNYIASGYSSSANRVYGATYDSSKAYVGNIATAVGTKTFSIGSGVSYIRLTGFTTEIDTYQVQTGTTLGTYEPYVGGIPSPNPDYPQDVNVVTGDNTITIYSKNLLDSSTIQQTTLNGITCSYDSATQVITFDGTCTTDNTNFNFQNTSFTAINGLTTASAHYVSGTVTNYCNLRFLKSDYSGTMMIDMTGLNENNPMASVTASADMTLINNRIRFNSGSIANNFRIKVMFADTTSISYEPYSKTEYPINLGSLELCKIGDYQDYIYKSSDKWYKHSEIEKKVLNGSETWTKTNLAFQTVAETTPNMGSVYLDSYSNKYIHHYYATGITTNIQNYEYGWNSGKNLTIRDDRYSTANDFKTALTTEKPIIYYVLATPTETEITDETLINQLEALASATTYLGQTNIITSGSDLAPLLDVTTYAVENPSFTITNSGNIYSKPIITIYGLGVIALYLNGIQALSLNMGETTSQITIDVANMEAYNQSGTLMNRSVTGNYNNLSLSVGNNVITESGTLQGIEVENYSRWL